MEKGWVHHHFKIAKTSIPILTYSPIWVRIVIYNFFTWRIRMKYISTRGHVAPQGFIDTVLMGLADDGGLNDSGENPTCFSSDIEGMEYIKL